MEPGCETSSAAAYAIVGVPRNAAIACCVSNWYLYAPPIAARMSPRGPRSTVSILPVLVRRLIRRTGKTADRSTTEESCNAEFATYGACLDPDDRGDTHDAAKLGSPEAEDRRARCADGEIERRRRKATSPPTVSTTTTRSMERGAVAAPARRPRLDRHVRSLLPRLAKERQVIAVDLHGHGRTALGDRSDRPHCHRRRPGGVLRKLGYDRSMCLAIRSAGARGSGWLSSTPKRVRRLAFVSAPYAQDGFYPEMLPQQAAVSAAMADAMKQTPMYQSYVAVAPTPEDFPTSARPHGRAHAQAV